MWFWWFMLGCNMLIPTLLILVGLLMWKKPPKNINMLYGYRTERSMANQETWEFAQKHSGKTMLKVGLIMLFPSLLINIPFYSSSEGVVGAVGLIVCAVQLLALIASVIYTETALKKEFEKE